MGSLINPMEDSNALIREAKAHNRPVTIKNGGYSFGGFSTTNGGILLNLSRMNKVTLDMTPGSEAVTLQGGARWGHAYKALVDGGHNGWFINGGRCPIVGVSGFVLGGDLSPFTRSFGMGCDTLQEATIVTANGQIVKVTDKDDKTSDEGKLFWALCGAGGGNFGVVVEMKMKVQKLEGKSVVAGLFVWAPKPGNMDSFMATMVDFYTAEWPNQTTIDSSWLCDLNDPPTTELKVRFPIPHNGNKANFDATADENIKNQELAKPLKRRTLEELSTRFLFETLVSQWSFENQSTLSSATGKYRIYTSVVLTNDKPTITGVTAFIRKQMKDFRDLFAGEEGLLQVTWIHTGGEASREKTTSTTAYPWRSSVYHTYVMLERKEKWLTRDMKDFLKTMSNDLRKFSVKGHAAFVNFPDSQLKAHEEAYFGPNLQALREVKKRWDPDHFFEWHQGVKLPQQTQTMATRGASRGASSTEETFESVVDEDVEEEDESYDEFVGKAPTVFAARNGYEGIGALSLADLGF
ncbi:uncharacterized protein C8A04DRAFT_29134 [Dichotomopilus funicola]|uniref:FAD-binding PCMH-type domain-containing protein n=1 Tax=Dichotomopilus funicola TaxID=1934379 RepID=A0AAN6V1G1_9PEZI|nr:hypothetical protein C8A04DRAFT_29134 [Dichotomopilus funicola]